MSINPVNTVNPVASGATANAAATGVVSALDARVKTALGPLFASLKNRELPEVGRFALFHQGLLKIPLQSTQGLDQSSPEAESRRNNNRTAVYEYARDFRFTSDETGNAASLLLKATALKRVRETMRDQERQAMSATGALPTPHAEMLAATLDTTVGVLGFIELSVVNQFMQSMLMDDEAFEVEKEW